MNGGKIAAGLSVFLVVAETSGCMRFHSDVYYEHNVQIEIKEDGRNSGKITTHAAYRQWGQGPGHDGIYGTGDDDLAGGYIRIVRDEADRLQSVSYSASSGPDEQWFTDDDKLAPLVSYVTDGNMEVWTMRSSQGPSLSTVLDDFLFPPSLRRVTEEAIGGIDIGRPYGYKYFGEYSLPQALLSELAGEGGEGASSYSRSTYEFIRITTADGLEIRQVLASGADGRWGTSDDLVERIWRLTKTGAAYSIFEYSEPGLDRSWGTQDDTFVSGAYLAHDATGEIVLERYVTDLGVDKLPFTADDSYVAAIDRRSWSEGAKSFVSIQSAWLAGPSDAGPITNLTRKFTYLLVFDRTFLPSYWTAAAEYFIFSQLGDRPEMSYRYAQEKSFDATGSALEVGLYSTLHNCLPSNFVTLEPCVTQIRQDKMPVIEPSQTFKRLSDNTIQIESAYVSPYQNDFKSRLIRIDRTAK